MCPSDIFVAKSQDLAATSSKSRCAPSSPLSLATAAKIASLKQNHMQAWTDEALARASAESTASAVAGFDVRADVAATTGKVACVGAGAWWWAAAGWPLKRLSIATNRKERVGEPQQALPSPSNGSAKVADSTATVAAVAVAVTTSPCLQVSFFLLLFLLISARKWNVARPKRSYQRALNIQKRHCVRCLWKVNLKI